MGKDEADKRRRRKKRVFASGKPYFKPYAGRNVTTEHVQAEDENQNLGDVSQPISGPSQPTNGRIPQAATKHHTIYKGIVNKSKEKLKHSLYYQNLGRRRSQRRKFCGNTRKDKNKVKSNGYKLIDVELLQKSSELAVICKHCKRHKSKMDFFNVPSSKKGLSEQLILRCSCCGHENKFMNSRKCVVNRKKSANAYEINVRTTYASQTMGHRELERFCGFLRSSTTSNKKAVQHTAEKYIRCCCFKCKKNNERADRAIAFCLEEDPDQSIEV